MGKKDSLQDALSQFWNMSQKRDINISVGTNMYDWFNASLSGDTKKMQEVKKRIYKSLAESKLKDLTWLRNDLSEEEYATFIEIDTQYKDHIGWTNRPEYHGDWYRYIWYLGDKEYEYGEYGKHGVLLKFERGKYVLFIWYSDESGYDQGSYIIKKEINYKDIFDEINKIDKL